MKTLCIYHAKCADGFGAAWVVRRALGADNVEFHAGHYGQPAPDVAGRHVLIVDFSYPLELLKLLAAQASSVLVIDHHKSAADALAALPDADLSVPYVASQQRGLATVFDMDRSGAGLTWDFFNPGIPRPRLIDHIEDRDLWRFKLEGTREVMAALFSYPQEFEVWDELFDLNPLKLFTEGKAISRKHSKDLADLLPKGAERRMTIGQHDVPAANLPHIFASDAGHLLAKGEPFAACYWDTATTRHFSLRSNDAGLDVSVIASQYGGGGHRNAAGFSVPLTHELATGYVQATIESTCVLTCVYCGHEYPQDTPAAGHQVLTDHIRACSKHPMREAEQAALHLHAALSGLIGESTPQGLVKLEAAVHLVPMPPTEKALMITAIRVLRETSGFVTAVEVQP